MTATIPRGFPHLSPAEFWLLGAATQPDSVARTAWERWRARFRLDTAGAPSQALFAMLYANLIADLGGPETTLLKGVYRRTWYANQLAFAQLRQLLDRLAAQGVNAIVLNDAALAAGLYPDIGYRTIGCLDILVRAKDCETGITAATAEGWHGEPGKSFGSPSTLSIMAFGGPERCGLRIWTNLFAADPREDTEDRVWGQAGRAQVNGCPAPTLGPVQQLLCTSAESVRAGEVPLVLYADAALLARSITTRSEWVELVWQAQRYERILPLRSMLAFVQAHLSVPVPSWVVPALYKMAISHGELLQYHRVCESLPLRFKSACLRHVVPLLPRRSRAT